MRRMSNALEKYDKQRAPAKDQDCTSQRVKVLAFDFPQATIFVCEHLQVLGVTAVCGLTGGYKSCLHKPVPHSVTQMLRAVGK